MFEFFDNIGKFFQRLPEDREYFIFTISAWSVAFITLILWFVWIGIAKHRKKRNNKLEYLLNEKANINVTFSDKINMLDVQLTKSKSEIANLNAIIKNYENEFDLCNNENDIKINELNKQIQSLQDQVNKYSDENLSLHLEVVNKIQNELELQHYKEENAKLEKKIKSLKAAKNAEANKRSKSYLDELRIKKRPELFVLAKEYGLTDYAKMTNDALCKKISRAYLKKKREEDNNSSNE